MCGTDEKCLKRIYQTDKLKLKSFCLQIYFCFIQLSISIDKTHQMTFQTFSTFSVLQAVFADINTRIVRYVLIIKIRVIGR